LWGRLKRRRPWMRDRLKRRRPWVRDRLKRRRRSTWL
jgi:hypothetical protein